MPRQNQTTVKLSEVEVYCLLDALEGQHTHNLTEEELATHDRMFKRLQRALDRV